MLFIFSTPVLIKHLWRLRTVVFLHWCLIDAVQLENSDLFKWQTNSSCPLPPCNSVFFEGCHKTQHKDIYPNNTRHKRLICETQQKYSISIEFFTNLVTLSFYSGEAHSGKELIHSSIVTGGTAVSRIGGMTHQPRTSAKSQNASTSSIRIISGDNVIKLFCL